MARFQVTLEVDGKAEFDRGFNRIGAEFRDLRPVWEAVRDEFWKIEKEQFNSEGSAGKSGKWKRLAPAYERQKAAGYGPGTKILQASGAMVKSLTGKTSDSVVDITKDGITIGTKLKRAAYHQRGAGRLPQRKVIDFSEKQKERMMKRIQKKLVEQMKKAGIPVS